MMMLKAVIECIRMSVSLIGKGEFFALIANGESMIDADIYPEALQIQGVAVSVTHKLGKIL